MSLPAAPLDPRPWCPACRQPAEGCWCPGVAAHRPRARVVFLQHPREARNPLGTARMAHLCLPGSSLWVGIDFAGDPRRLVLQEAERGRLAVVYPAPGARPASELARWAGPMTLLFLDGTWWQARKLWRSNPWLRELPAYRIEPEAPSRYLIRGEPAPHCLSTVEAVAAALDALEGEPGRHAAMLAPLDALVARQLQHADSKDRSPRRRGRTGPRRAKPPDPLQDRLADAVLVHAEGNGWPARASPRPPAELVQLVALRPATGERFAALVRPAAGFSPTLRENLGLDPDDFPDLVGPGGLAGLWGRFARPSDVWCAWGHLPLQLAAEAGLDAPELLDVRGWAHERLRSRPGTVEAAHEQLGGGAAEPVDPGRGGRRLALLAAVFGKLTATYPAG